jgi:pimeloyl-ACP methyl ester carboxylesterase
LFSKYVTIDGTAIRYLHTGPSTLPGVVPALDRGRLFLLLPAEGGGAGLWRRQLEALGARHSAVALDPPGHGRSGGVEGPDGVEAYARVVRRFVAALRLRPCVLVGHGLGATVALALAAAEPGLAQALGLVCACARVDLPDAALSTLADVVRGRLPQQFGTEAFSPAASADAVRETWWELVATDPRVRLADLRAWRAFDARPLLPGVRVPTLVIAGADDTVTPPASAEELARAIPGARLAVVDAAGHHAPLEQPEGVSRRLVEFAEGLP